MISSGRENEIYCKVDRVVGPNLWPGSRPEAERKPKAIDADKDICKMIETGSVRRNGLSLFSRMKTEIFWDLWAFLTNLLNK